MNGRNSDNTKILQHFGWEPSIRLRDGLALTYEWIERQIIGVEVPMLSLSAAAGYWHEPAAVI